MSTKEVSFGPFRLDLEQRVLSRGATPMRLRSRALEILCVLASAKGELVTKDELMARVWPDVVVEENVIQVHVSALRKALDEGRSDQSHIVTVPGRGYRLAGLQPSPPAFPPETNPRREPAFTDRSSIAVLPFRNMSSDPEQDYFADGMVEDIIAGLSRIKWLFVIARNSSFIYKDKTVDGRQIARELGVRYLLDGGVRKSGNRIRVTGHLVEAETGTCLWVERYDRLLDDIFAVQDEITMSVIGAIEPSMRNAETERIKRKRPGSLDAYDLFLRSLQFVSGMMAESAAPAIPLLERALELEPGYASAHGALAWCYHCRYSRGTLDERDRAAALRHARAAVSCGGDDAAALAMAGLVIWFDDQDGKTALDLFDRAIALSNSNIFALCCSAAPLAWMGETELAIARAKQALRLSPFDSMNFLSYDALALSYLQTERYAEALDAALHAAECNPTFSVPKLLQTAALVCLGRNDEAKITARQVLKLDPAFSIRKYAVVLGHVPTAFAALANAWREAGLPER
jgi:TolB-like protein/tetratricopeptide (TPR) repeat protein